MRPHADDIVTRAEAHARDDADGHFESDLSDDGDAPINVYYWVTRTGGRLVAPEVEIEAYDAVTGEPYEIAYADEDFVKRLAVEHWVEDGDGMKDYYSDDI